ncbi:MurR/RpiR family transcriptional regulator [Microvirga sp. 17 mud 1-3]|uniref:MurR/RpiR family transcriptional regulator n=1 Tax=Microvirga sp. 17 mud 1-3 TaxID=2082949 RepID=UPI000D6BE342|nr:MurR/RpiR family transcriptional regulator [Microvirga sp. 17 mud 1-3]AWM88440.1 RpiR family transcriptional regulator [Microvirga sp. 17 mud 1-3]
MSESIRKVLEDKLADTTPSGRAIAQYILANLRYLPFESSASLARKIGVSEVTVGRFCRSLGYRHFKEFKAELRDDLSDSPWRLGERLQEFQRNGRTGQTLPRSLELHIEGLVKVYELAQGREMATVAKRIATRKQILIAGFQTERSNAMMMALHLQYLRDGVQLVDVGSGHFAEVLLGDPQKMALVIFENRRYSQQAELLARQAHELDVPVTIITDEYNGWAKDCSSEAFYIPTELNLFWASSACIVTFVHLLVNAVFVELGAGIEDRLNQIARSYGQFVGHVGRNAPPFQPTD